VNPESLQWPTIIIVNIFSVTLFSYLDPPIPQGFLSNFYNDPPIIIVNTFSIKFIKCEQRKKTANKASKQGLPTNIVNDACQSPPPPIIDPFLQILENSDPMAVI